MMSVLVVLGVVAGGCTSILTVAGLIRGAWRLNKRIVAIANAVQQLLPNGGTTLADKVTRIDEVLTEHVTNHPPASADHPKVASHG